MRSGRSHQTPALLANLSVEVRRVFQGEKKTVFSYIGDVDAAKIAIVLDHVERLCATVAGEWYVEVESMTPGPLLFKSLTHRFTDLRRRGIRECLRVVPTSLVDADAASGVSRWYRPLSEAPW